MHADPQLRCCSMYTASCRVFRLFGPGASVHGAIFRKFGAYGTVPYGNLYALPETRPGAGTLQVSGVAAFLLFSFDLCHQAASYTPVAELMFDFIPNSDYGWVWLTAFRTLDVSWLYSFEVFRRVFGFLLKYSKFTFKTMANQIPVNQLTVAQAHQEFTKLVDQISAKFVQLDSGEFGAVGTPAFDAKMHDLAVLFARMSQLCGRLGLPIPAHLHRPPFFKH